MRKFLIGYLQIIYEIIKCMHKVFINNIFEGGNTKK